MLKDKPYSFPLRPQHPKGGKRRLSSKLRSIQVTITLTFTSVAVLVAVVVSLMLYNKFAKTAEENANMNMQQIIEQVNYNLGLYVKGMRNIFETAEEQITNSPSVDSALLTERMAMLMGSREDLVSAAVFTPQGNMSWVHPVRSCAATHSWRLRAGLRRRKEHQSSPIPHLIFRIYSKVNISGSCLSAN